jgi:hypothetical protein
MLMLRVPGGASRFASIRRSCTLFVVKSYPSRSRIQPPGPGFRDWALLAIGVTFVAMGIFLWVRNGIADAAMPLTFFGVCTAVFAHQILRKIRRQRFTGAVVSVPGGVKLRGSNAGMLMVAAAIGVPGVAILVFERDAPMLIRVCVVVMLVASAGMMLFVLSGRHSRRFLRFDPEGLTIGEYRYEYLIRWDEVVDVVEFEMHDNAAVGFNLRDLAGVTVTPASAQVKAHKRFGTNQGMLGRDVVLMPFHFGVRGESLCAALLRYSSDRAARAELVRTPKLGSDPISR